MHHTKVVAFTGPSNSGKTTLIRRLIEVADKKVAVIKHDPKDKAIFDTPGKDSDIFFRAGAQTAVISPTRTTIFSHQKPLIEVLGLFKDVDFVFIEGLRHLPYPRIGVFRNHIDASYFPHIDAVAIDKTIDTSLIPNHLMLLDLNEIDSIMHWIKQNAKEIP